MSTLMSADYTAYKSLSQFETVAEMNEAIRAFLYSHKHELPDSAVAVLKTISRYACKLPGVAFMKVATIADKVGLSDRTVRRALKALEQAGIIERQTTTRRQGGDGHNVYVLRPVVSADVIPEMSDRGDAEKPRQSSDEPVQKASETKPHETEYSRLSNSKRNNVTDVNEQHLPQPFASAVRPFAAIINPNEAWRKVTLAHRQAAIETDVTADNIVHTAVGAFKAAVAAYKTNRIRKDLGGYFFGCLRNVFAVERRREVANTCDNDGLLFDWLAAAG